MYLGISTNKFDELVAKKMMPEPRMIGTRLIWDIPQPFPADQRSKA